MSSLLEEAIVDAKALKEAALKNAENVVLEKYSGEVKKALDTLLEQEDLEEGGVDETQTQFTEDVPYAFQNEELDEVSEDEIVEIDFDALKTRLEEEDEVVEEDTLNDALEMADEMAEGDPLDKMADRDAEEDAAELGATPVEPLEEDEDLNLSEDFINELVEELVLDMGTSPAGFSSLGGAYNSIEQANNDAIAAAKEAHLEEEEEEEIEEDTAPDVVPVELHETKISELTESNRELRALIVEAKDQLTKLNLDNAKLVYQNKALGSASLNERQKTQIVEAVQSANSVEEASMIFETIQNAVGSSPDQRTRPQTLREAVQRPTSLLINSKRNNEATKDPSMGRMLRLAGLNK
tara:strand:- start:28 stop:1086 length:1059 start_codon:yes stop_codon:yes gene_type:complete